MANPFFGIESSYLNQILCNSFVECGVSTTPTTVVSKSTELPTNTPDWGDVDSFCDQYGFYQDNPIENLLQMPMKNQETVRNDVEEGIVSCSDAKNVGDQEIPHLPDSRKMIEQTLSSDCLALVRNFQRKQFKRTGGGITNLRNEDTGSCYIRPEGPKLSTDQILKVAGERFMHLSSQKIINVHTSFYSHDSSLSGLSIQDKQDVDLVQLLLDAAEKVSLQQFELGIRLLRSCQWMASREGTPVQRAVFYFSEALRERIGKETGGSEKEEKNTDACLRKNNLAFIAMHQEVPFFQVLHFTSVQTILEHARTKSRVHIIDFQILTGLHWAALIQAMAQKAEMDPQSHLKITAVESFDMLCSEQTGNLLTSFAGYLNLPFSFKAVFVPDINDLREDDLGIDPNDEEAVAVHFSFMLRTLIARPHCLKNLMTVTQKIKPSVVVVCEAETNHNSPSFVNRFIEALFFYGALFDSLEESMGRDDENRMAVEMGAFGEGIRNIVAREGYERVTRSVSINVWRAFFARFGMVEMELSSASVYQASLIVKKFSCGRYCSLDVSSKCLIEEWKGTPLFSLSAWKFN